MILTTLLHAPTMHSFTKHSGNLGHVLTFPTQT